MAHFLIEVDQYQIPTTELGYKIIKNCKKINQTKGRIVHTVYIVKKLPPLLLKKFSTIDFKILFGDPEAFVTYIPRLTPVGTKDFIEHYSQLTSYLKG